MTVGSPEWYEELARLLGVDCDDLLWGLFVDTWRLIGLWEDPANPHGPHGTFGTIAKDWGTR